MMATATEEFVSGVDAARLAGVTYRQVDYWDQIGLVRPTLKSEGRGRQGSVGRAVRGYSRRDVSELALVGCLMDLGLSTRQISRTRANGIGLLDRIKRGD
jgi:DNA-binding transcriptional MerR regulator